MNKSFSWPIALSLGLHGLILVLILGDWSFLKTKKDEPPPPQFVTATLMDMTPKAKAQVQQLREQELESKRLQDLRDRKRQEDQRKQVAQAQEQKRREEAAKAAESEKIKQQKIKEETAKKEAAKKAEDAKRIEQERLKKLAEEKEKQAAAQAKAKREREAQEEKRKIEAARQEQAKHVSDTVDDVTENVKGYGQALIERVEQNWSRPASARNGMVARIEINMLPTGIVTGLRIIQSSGDPLFDAAAERAIRQVDRFTEVTQIPPDVFDRHFRTFVFTFTPEDLRQ